MLLVDSQLVLPAMHIKLGIMKNVLWALDKNSDGLNYLKQKFPKLSDEKIKEGIFVGLQIVQLLRFQVLTMVSMKMTVFWNIALLPVDGSCNHL
jgi:hypothetical protein